MRHLFPWLLLLILTSGCGPFQALNRQGGRTDFHQIEVPFYRQAGPYDCGPAALASLLAHGGRPLPAETIAPEVVTPALRGSLLPDLENFARRQGFATRSGRGDLDLLRQTILQGRPLIIPLEMGVKPVSYPHYIVVFGFDDDEGFLVHAGEKKSVFISSAELDRRWAAMNRLFLYLENSQP
ncbi:MAG: cysteine peptidase family C39 domain-containing protein [Syntrophotaleaceae bacterium]